MTQIINWLTGFGLHFEFTACLLLTVYWFPRREPFRRNVIVAVLGWLVCLFALGAFPLDNRLLQGAKYFILCFAYAFLLWIPFSVNLSDAFFYMAVAGAAQHLIYKISDLLAFLAVPGYPMELEKSVTYAAFFVIFLVIYALTGARLLARYKCTDLNKVQTAALVAGFLLIAGVYENVYKTFYTSIEPSLFFFMTAYDIITSLFVLILQIVFAGSAQSERNVSFMRGLLREQHLQMEASRENVEQISIKMHDLKQMIASLDKQVTKEQLDALYTAVSTYDKTARTGNDTLDVLLTEKSLTCENQHIQMSYIANGQLLDFIQDNDLYALVGNMLNNAIEAVLKVDNVEQRIIDMRVAEQSGCAMILVTNPVAEPPIIHNGRIETNKSDKQQHGFGIRSMKLIAQKYGGSFYWDYHDGEFSACAMLPLKSQENKA